MMGYDFSFQLEEKEFEEKEKERKTNTMRKSVSRSYYSFVIMQPVGYDD